MHILRRFGTPLFPTLAISLLALTACGGGGGSGGVLFPIPEQPTNPPVSFTPKTCENSTLKLTKGTVSVNGVDRDYYEYGPSNATELRENDAKGISMVYSFHDSGQNGQISADKTCWHEVGEAQGFVAVFPSAMDGRWNLAHSAQGPDEVAYLQAVWAAVRAKYALSTTNPSYVTGVGAGASMAQQMAMNTPTIAVAAVAGIRGVADASTYKLPAELLPASAMSAWIIRNPASELTAAENAQRDYWARANEVAGTSKANSDTFLETTVQANAANPYQEVRVSSVKVENYGGKQLSERIWNEMFSKVVRFDDNDSTNGSLHAQLSIKGLGLIDTTKDLGSGTPRRWLTFIPSSYAAQKAAGKRVPVVFSFHGRNGSARWQALITEWNKVAEEKGFIVVYPHGRGATWTTSIAADNVDVKFFLDLFEEVKSLYAVDTTRVFLNGSSQGTALTNRIAVQYPELFAAIAPCYSGHLTPANYANEIVKTNVPLPVWQCRGETELPTEFPGGTAGETAARNFWRETVNKNFGPPTKQIDGRNTTEIWNDGLAEYRWQITKDVPHFWHPGQASKMWNEMLSKYSRLPSGALARE